MDTKSKSKSSNVLSVIAVIIACFTLLYCLQFIPHFVDMHAWKENRVIAHFSRLLKGANWL
ncbi:hypothetical protein D3873_01730 [Paenisporosarcina cavernae]|uniref:Uncharacterized protein n=1 Tax=Paenisporosarcina cavernae TaxID=2320858 RepID=A0A385YQB3_9BACL|nr:hypothetical protein D3873_01730 [Paenisporosarcina cavernae]